MDITVLELHLHDASIDVGTAPPADDGESANKGAADRGEGGAGHRSAIPVLLGILIVGALVLRRVLNRRRSEAK